MDRDDCNDINEFFDWLEQRRKPASPLARNVLNEAQWLEVWLAARDTLRFKQEAALDAMTGRQR